MSAKKAAAPAAPSNNDDGASARAANLRTFFASRQGAPRTMRATRRRRHVRGRYQSAAFVVVHRAFIVVKTSLRRDSRLTFAAGLGGFRRRFLEVVHSFGGGVRFKKKKSIKKVNRQKQKTVAASSSPPTVHRANLLARARALGSLVQRYTERRAYPLPAAPWHSPGPFLSRPRRHVTSAARVMGA